MFLFIISQYNGKSYWECRQRRHGVGQDYKCPGRLVTAVKNGCHIPTKETDHTHRPDPGAAGVQKLRAGVKHGGRHTNKPPSLIMSEVGATVSSRVQARLSKNAQLQIIKRARPHAEADPKTIAEFVVPENLLYSIDGERFYQGMVETSKGDRAYVFTTKSDLIRLSTARFWTADGTFHVSPLLQQLYSIHCSLAPLHKTTVPAAYILMTSKSKELYIKVLEKLLEVADRYRIKLAPQQVMTDFEKAMINSYRHVFPRAEHSGCFFHFAQALWRRLDGISAAVAQNEDLFHHFELVKSLAFLPPKDIPRGKLS